MKKLFKRTFSLLTTVAVTLSCLMAVPTASFAADPETGSARDIECSHIEFVAGQDAEGADTVKARAFIRDYSGSKDKVSLLCASYDEGGNLIGAGVKSGINAVLSTGGYNIPNQTVRTIAYVWDQATLAPITGTATRGAEITPTITLDGKSFKDYMGVDFDKNTTSYSKELKYKNNPFLGTEELTWPKVRVNISDMSGSYQVINDPTSMTTTVRVFSGDRIINPETLVGKGSSTERMLYTKPHTDYVISWSVPEGKFLSNSLVAGSAEHVSPEQYWTYKNTTDVPAGKVEFNVSGFSKQDGILIVKPKDETAGKDIIVADADNTAITWKRDKFTGRVAYDESTGTSTYGEKSENAPVTLSGNGKTINTWVCRATAQSDDSYISGSGVATDRSPLGAKGIARMASDLLGYNYMPISSDSVASTVGSNFKVEFYLNAPAELIWLSVNNITLDTYTWKKKTADAASDSELAPECRTIRTSWKKCFAVTRYVDAFSAYTAAKAIKELGILESELVLGGNANYTLSDASTLTAQEYRMNRYCDYYKIYDTYGNKSFVPSGAAAEAAKYTKLDDILNAMIHRIGGATNEIGDVISNLTADYKGLNISLKEFPLTEEGMFSDRNPFGANAEARTGALISYPDALELDGIKFVYPCIGWINDSTQTAADYTNSPRGSYTPNPEFDGKWFNFIAKDDCEVVVLTTTNYTSASDPGSGWIVANSGGNNDQVKIVNTLGGSSASLFYVNNIYLKKFKAGEKVQIMRGGNHKFIFARRLPADVNESEDNDTTVGAANVEITSPVYEEKDTVNKIWRAKRDSEGNIVTQINTTHTNKANRILKLAVNTGGTGIGEDGKASTDGLGSMACYDRGYPANINANPVYTNEVFDISKSYKSLLGSDYIMSAGQSTERESNGYETSFTLYKDATVAVFTTTKNNAKAAELGWTVKESTTPHMQLMLNNKKNLYSVVYKHFTVTDKTNGIKVTIPREILFAEGKDGVDIPLDDNGKPIQSTGTSESLKVICYD